MSAFGPDDDDFTSRSSIDSSVAGSEDSAAPAATPAATGLATLAVPDDTIKLIDGIGRLESKNFTAAIAIAGLATSGIVRGGRYSPEDVLKANAKMYAGVKVKLTPLTPTDWVYMTTDSKTKSDDTHRTLEQVAVTEKQRATEMYQAIVGLAVGKKTPDYDKILGKISIGATWLEQNFKYYFILTLTVMVKSRAKE